MIECTHVVTLTNYTTYSKDLHPKIELTMEDTHTHTQKKTNPTQRKKLKMFTILNLTQIDRIELYSNREDLSIRSNTHTVIQKETANKLYGISNVKY